MTKYLLSIIIPAYNEEDNILNSFNEAVAAVEMCNIKSYQIVIVDDCSKDRTRDIIAALAEQEHVEVGYNKTNLNLGGSYKEGLKLATGEYITWVPGDGSHKREHLSRVYKHIGEANLLIAVPDNTSSRPLARRILSKLYTILVNLASKQKIPYYNGLSVYSSQFVKNTYLKTNGFSFQAELMTKCLKSGIDHKVCYTSLDESDNRPSKAFTLKNIMQVIYTLIELNISEKKHKNT